MWLLKKIQKILILRINITYGLLKYLTELTRINLTLSQGQKRKLLKAYRKHEEVTLRLSDKALTGGNDTLLVPNNIARRMRKNVQNHKGVQIRISKSNIPKQEGSGIFRNLAKVALQCTISKDCWAKSC